MTATQVIIQLIGAFFSVYTAAMIFDAPKNIRYSCGFVAVISWAIYLFVKIQSDSEPTAVYASAIFISLCAQVAARKIKIPVTVILLPSLFLLVPGIAIYRAVYYVMRNDNVMAGKYTYLTVMTAAMIALAVFSSDFLTKLYFRCKLKLMKLYKERREKNNAI